MGSHFTSTLSFWIENTSILAFQSDLGHYGKKEKHVNTKFQGRRFRDVRISSNERHHLKRKLELHKNRYIIHCTSSYSTCKIKMNWGFAGSWSERSYREDSFCCSPLNKQLLFLLVKNVKFPDLNVREFQEKMQNHYFINM